MNNFFDLVEQDNILIFIFFDFIIFYFSSYFSVQRIVFHCDIFIYTPYSH